MAKKKSKNGGEKQNNDQQPKKENSNQGEKKDDGPITVVLKVQMDCECEGCAIKIRKYARESPGVESVKGLGDSNKLTVVGKVDPVKLREILEKKAKKKVELVSPLPKKDKDNKDGGGGGEKKAEGKPEKNPDEKKSKEPPVTTAVMKVALHCKGCVQKIRKTVTKMKGYHDMSIDDQKNLLTVKGAMDMKALAETLKEKLKKPVEIVPPKKEGGEKKEKEGDGEKKEKEGGGEKGKGGGGKGKGGGEVGQSAAGDGGGTAGVHAEENRIQYVQYGYPNPHMYGYEFGYPVVHPSPEIFSDENPNACSVM